MATPPYNISENIPLSSDILNQYPTQSAVFRDIVESWLSQISDPATGNLRDLVMDVRTNAPATPATGDQKLYFRDYGGAFPVLEYMHDDGIAVNAATVGQAGSADDLLINGDFRIWQRTKVWGGTSLAMLSGATFAYVADHWVTYRSGGQQTISRQEFTPGQTLVPGEPQYFMRMVRSVAGTSSNLLFSQPVEDVRKLPGRFVTFSAWVRSSVTKDYRILLAQFFGTGGSANVDAIGPTVSLVANTWTRVYWAGIIAPSIVGKTLGVGHGTNIGIAELNADNDTFTFDIAEASLRYGDWSSFSTPPARRSYDEEFRLAQHYYRVYGGNGKQFEYIPGSGTMFSTVTGIFIMPLGNPMRIMPPTWSFPAYSRIFMLANTAGQIPSNITVGASEQPEGAIKFELTPTVAMTAGAGLVIRANTTTDVLLILDAEL